MKLYDPDRHIPLKESTWSSELARQAVERLFQETIRGFDSKKFWPTHPDEDGHNPCNKSLYFGAAGTLLALSEISEFLGTPLPWKTDELIDQIYRAYLADPDTNSVVPSYFLGTTGILLVHYKFSQSSEIADILFQEVESNIDNPVNEALWGCPGSMLAALQMHNWTREARWLELFKNNVNYLLEEWKADGPDEMWVWTQNLYGSVRQIVGAGHGFFGNAFPLLKGAGLLSTDAQNLIYDRVSDTLIRSAKQNGELANWPVVFKSDEPRFSVQWCHGAPGVITSMTDFPVGRSEDAERLLVQGGNLIWESGPLKKQASICHGTDGNGIAFLKLFERTSDPLWLSRARSFAAHMLDTQVDRYTYWTGGKVGLAHYLMGCLNEKGQILGLDGCGKTTSSELPLESSSARI